MSDLLARATELLATGVLTPWQRAFVVGCERHVSAGRALSSKQIGVLNALLDIASDCPGQASEMSRQPGQKDGTGHARAYGERDIVPVPSPMQFCPGVSRSTSRRAD
jgi:hypothetical protein